MSFWDNDHPTHQEMYDILYNKYVPGVGKCSTDEAEAIRLVSGVGYQLYNNGCWFGTGNYHVKEYMSQNICSAADDLMHMLDYLYKQSDEYLEDHAWNDLSDEEKEQRVEEALEWVVDEAWERLADEDDKKELSKRNKKKAALKKKEERASKKRKRSAKKADKEEVKKLKILYKQHSGKRFRRRKNASGTILEILRQTNVEQNGSKVSLPTILSDMESTHGVQQPEWYTDIFKKPDPPVVAEAETSPMVDITQLSPEMAKYAEFMIPDPERLTFAVSESEFLEYTFFQKGYRPMPAWFHTDDKKATEIMSRFNELRSHYSH